MPDSDSIDTAIKAGTHIVAGGGGAGIVAWLSHALRAKESQLVSTELALLRNDVNTLAKALDKHANVNERLALVEASLKAVHERMDTVSPKSRRRR